MRAVPSGRRYDQTGMQYDHVGGTRGGIPAATRPLPAKITLLTAPNIRPFRLHPPSLSPQGALRVSRFNPFEGCVGSDSVGHDILISGRVDMNRALDGEEVWTSAGKCVGVSRHPHQRPCGY